MRLCDLKGSSCVCENLPKLVVCDVYIQFPFVNYLTSATMALDAGLCDVALIVYGSNQRTASGKLVTASRPPAYEAPYNPRYPISGYAMAAARHMHEYGTTREQLADVAVAARAFSAQPFCLCAPHPFGTRVSIM